jgi:hypothetical protein
MALLKAKLSGSSDGMPINTLATTSTGATTIHTFTTSTGANTWDEIYLWGFNNGTGNVDITLEYGSTTAIIVQTLSPKTGNTLILPGTVGNAGTVLKAFKSGTTAMGLIGFINSVSS